MTTDSKPTREEAITRYAEQYEAFGDVLREKLSERAAEVLDSALIMYGEPKAYRDFRGFADTLCESLVLYLVSDGYLTIPDEYVASDEVRAERKAKREQAMAASASPALRDPNAPVIPAGAYL